MISHNHRQPNPRQTLLHKAAQDRGYPEAFLTDNGAIFTATSRGNDLGAIEPELLSLGIRSKHSRPYHPQTCGKVERFHQTLKKHLAKQPPAATKKQLQGQLDRFVDHFHVIRLANTALDEVRRRTQQATTGHRGRKADPLYRIRRRLLASHDRLDPAAFARMLAWLDAGDPEGEVGAAYLAKELLRETYLAQDALEARRRLVAFYDHCTRSGVPELERLARTIARWETPILRWHRTRLTNAATEGTNLVIKNIKRLGFGFRNFDNYRLRLLLRPMADSTSRINTTPPTTHQRVEPSNGPTEAAKQLDQKDQARRLRSPQVRPLPATRAALRRQAQLGQPRYGHTPVKSEAPD